MFNLCKSKPLVSIGEACNVQEEVCSANYDINVKGIKSRINNKNGISEMLFFTYHNADECEKKVFNTFMKQVINTGSFDKHSLLDLVPAHQAARDFYIYAGTAIGELMRTGWSESAQKTKDKMIFLSKFLTSVDFNSLKISKKYVSNDPAKIIKMNERVGNFMKNFDTKQETAKKLNAKKEGLVCAKSSATPVGRTDNLRA